MKKAVGVLALSFVVLQVADSFLTMWAVNNGYKELNPIIEPIAGTYWMPVFKVIPAIGVGILAVWVMRRFPKFWKVAPKAVVFGLGSACAFLGIVLASNLKELIN